MTNKHLDGTCGITAAHSDEDHREALGAIKCECDEPGPGPNWCRKCGRNLPDQVDRWYDDDGPLHSEDNDPEDGFLPAMEYEDYMDEDDEAFEDFAGSWGAWLQSLGMEDCE